MPLTLSHPAAVLPLARLGLPMSGLVAGAMVPDVPMLVGRPGYAFTHSSLGVVTIDPLLALIGLLVWFTLVRDALVDASPSPVRRRLPTHAAPSLRGWLLMIPATVIGAATHAIWDAFTHPGRWGTDRIAFLHEVHAGLPMWRWAQYVSGVLGLMVVLAACVRHLRSRPTREIGPRRVALQAGLAVVLAVAATYAAWVAASWADQGLHLMLFHSVIAGIVSTAGLLVLLGVTWRVARRLPVRG